MEFSRQESWSGVPFPSPGDLLNQGIEPMSPSLQADALPSELPGKPQYWKTVSKNNNLLKTKIVRVNLNGFLAFWITSQNIFSDGNRDSQSSVVAKLLQLSPTLCEAMDHNLPGSSVDLNKTPLEI